MIKLLNSMLLIGLASSFGLNRSILIEKYGYSIDSVNIDLSNEKISSIDLGTFNDFFKLEILYLEHNKLTQIKSGTFKGLINLRELWLESNSLASIDKNVFVGLDNLELVCLNNNPISVYAPISLTSICNMNSKCKIKLEENCTRRAITTPIMSILNLDIILLFNLLNSFRLQPLSQRYPKVCFKLIN